MIRVSRSCHNIIYDIINWNAMMLDMISYVSLLHYYLCRQPLLLLPGCNCDTGYTAANLQRYLWYWSCWPAYPTRLLRWRRWRCSVAEVWPSLWQAGRERRNTELGSGHSTSCGWEHGGKEAERLFAKAVESELSQALVRGLKQHGKIINLMLILRQLLGCPGFTEHCKFFCVQLFLVVFREVPVLPDNPLQPMDASQCGNDRPGFDMIAVSPKTAIIIEF